MDSIKIFTVAVFASSVLLFACKQDSKQPNPPNIPTPAAKPEVYLYTTTVDKLNLRDQPSKSGKVLVQLPEGAFVEGRGEVSNNREEATLREITWNEPYIKVTTPTPETGWAYGGGLQQVYAGTRAGSPDLNNLLQLTSFFKTLDTKKLDSGKKAWEFVNTNFASANGSLADAAFILLERFLRRMEHEGKFYELTEKVKWSDEDYQAIADNQFDVNKNPVAKSMAENGFELVQGEGMVFPVVDWSKLYTFFGSKVSPVTKNYLNQQLVERNEQAWSDGGLIISLEKLADRAAFWEKFNLENPYFTLNEQTKESERWTRLVLMNGADNTPTFDYESQAIAEAYKKVWAYIQQKYPNTTLASRAKEIADLCAAEGWKRTKKVEEWQAKFGEAY